MSTPETSADDWHAKFQRAMTPEVVELIRSLPHPISEDDIPLLMVLTASLGLLGNDPFPLPLKKLPSRTAEEAEQCEEDHDDA